MVRVADKKLIFWLAGYYDDFTNAAAVPDDSNTMGSTWESIETHAGNPLNGLAPYNPRYKYAWFIRGTGASDADFNGFSDMSATIRADRYLHNAKMGEWLTFDPEWYNQGQYEGTTHIQYPDSKVNANRQKFDGGTGLIGDAYLSTDPVEGFMIFCNGYNTQGQYYAFTGNNDSSYGRDTMNWSGKNTSGTLDSTAGEPDNAPAPTYRIDTHIAGVYSGEIVDADDAITGNSDAGARKFHLPIHSLSKTPFLVQEVYNNAASGFIPTLVYQGSLNCKGDDDVFTFRAYCMSNTSSDTRMKILIGNSNNPIGITSSSTGDSTNGTYAIDYLLDVEDYQTFSDISDLTPSGIEKKVIQAWQDYEFVLDFTNQRYQIFEDGVAQGSTTSFTAHPDGRDWTPADFYGWEIQMEKVTQKATILIDRVGVCRYINDYPSYLLPSGFSMPVANKFDYVSAVNSPSSVTLEVIDDNTELSMLEFFNQASYSDWSLLCFRDEINKPFWRGSLTSINQRYNANQRTPTITITANDHLEDLDHQIPIWELGEGGDADSTSVVAYNRQDSQNRISTYYFGATPLQVGNAGLGYNEVEDGSDTWKSHVDTRMRLRSAHPIQVYNNEDGFGINNADERWDDAITDGYADTDAKYRSLHARWVQDLPKSQWFSHMFGKIKEQPLVSTTNVGAFSVGDTSLTLRAGGFSLEDGGHIEFVDSDGTVDSGVVTSATFTNTHTDIQVAWIHVFETLNGNIVSFNYSNEDYILANTGASKVQGVALVPTSLDLHHEVRTIRGSQWPIFNREWGFVRTDVQVAKANSSGGSTSYTMYELRLPASRVVQHSVGSTTVSWDNALGAVYTLSWSGQALKSTRVNWNDITSEDGIGQYYIDYVWNDSENVTLFGLPTNVDWRANEFARTKAQIGNTRWRHNIDNKYIYSFVSIGGEGTYNIGIPDIVQDAVGGNAVLTLPATNFFQKDHSADTVVNVLDIQDDFKHTYVLWADMRNDGNANADGYFRKSNFGLLEPSSQNYEVSLVFGDQNTDSGLERQEFVDLSAGEDYDMWQMDAMVDPISGTTWSSVTGGSDSESDSKYHNWEEKAGAFVIIDTSKFFNLNTYSNGGMSGQVAGGRKEIGDYIVETEGFPILIDNYWARASTTPYNIDDFRAWSPHHQLINNNATSLREGIRVGDRAIQLLDDVIKIHANESGTDNYANLNHPTVGKIVSKTKESVFHFNASGRLGLDTVSYNISSVNPETSATVNGEVFIEATTGANQAHYLRDGHYIEISNSTSTPSIDGTYRLLPHPDCTVGNGANWVGRIKLDTASATITSGTCSLSFPFSYGINRLDSLGEIKTNSAVSGEWDGTSYSGIGLTTSWLSSATGTIAHNATANTLTLNAGGGSETWHSFGFAVGMTITIDDSTNTGNNGTHTITDISSSGLVITVGSLSNTYSAGATTNVYSEHYNTNSAEWLINNKPQTAASVAPNITTVFNPITGTRPFHEGAQISIPLVGDDAYEDAVVYGNAASVFPMRLMMQVEGFTKNKASMTFFEHDKFRVTYLDSLTKNWLNQANLLGIPDIGTIPRTDVMNIGQKDAHTTGRGGKIESIAAGTVAGRNQITSTGHGLVEDDVIEILSNNLLSSITVAPYSTEYTVVNKVDADVFEIATSNTNYSPSNLGVWRKVGEVDSFGSVVDCRNTTIANIFSQVRQVSGTGDDNGVGSVFSYYMTRDSKPAFRPTYNNGFAFTSSNLRVSQLEASSNVQISNVRVFYGGEGSYVDHPQASLGAKPRWEIIQAPELSSKDEALFVAKREYEKQSKAPMKITCEITKLSDKHTLDGANDRMMYNARFGYIADQSRSIIGYWDGDDYAFDKAMYWTSLRGGNLFGGIQNALEGKTGGSDKPSSETATTPFDNYHWYGANSVSYALQVVHVPHGMPKTTDDTPATGGSFTKVKLDGCLRVAIDIAPETSSQGLIRGNDIDKGNYIFRVHLIDYDFIATTASTPAGIGFATAKSQTSVKVDSNGLYEIEIPSTYWSDQTGDERILLSVNYDYLCALVKLRCAGTDANRRLNGNSFEGVTYSSTNSDSIFPLGMRSFNNIGYWAKRKEYYAPRLNITDDLNFTVGTTLEYTDSRLGLSREKLGIKNISWSMDGRDTEKLSLTLERDVSRAAKGFASYILPKVNMGGKQKGGGGKGKPFPPALNPPKGKGGLNAGKPQQGTRQDKFGDEVAGTTRGAKLLPNTSPPRDNRPDGSTSAVGSNMVIGSSALSNKVNRRIKGTMDFNNSSVVGDNFSILGQKKPAPAPRNTSAQQSIDSFVIPDGGTSAMDANGFSMAGTGEGIAAYSSLKAHLRVPANPQSNSVRVLGRVTLNHPLTTVQTAVLYVTVKCMETDHSIERTVRIDSTKYDSQSVVFFEGNLRGADVEGNTIEILFEREAGVGDDDASRSALSIHNIQVASDTRSVSGKSKSNEFTNTL